MARLAFWNTTLPAGNSRLNQAKRQVLQQFIYNCQPDLLFLTEMSADFDSRQALSDLIDDCMHVQPPGHGVNERTNRYTCLARNANEGVHLMMGIFARPQLHNLRAGLIELRGWADGQRRALLYAEWPGARFNVNILLLHARASAAGGRDAVETLLGHLGSNPGNLVGGDFNYSSYTDPNNLLTDGNLGRHNHAEFFAPAVGDHCPLAVPFGGDCFTQFRKDAHGTHRLPGTFIQYTPGYRIDFMLGGHAHGGTVTAVDPMPPRSLRGDISDWEREVFTYFDHLPVVYDWAPPNN